MLTGTTIAALGISPSGHAEWALPTPSLSDRLEQRAGRGEQRSAPADISPSAVPTSSSPSPKPPPTPSKTATRAPQPLSGSGAVTTSGTCQASFYTDQGSRTANGETFNTAAFTAAHKTLPFNTRVRVTNVNNGKSVVVRINDRGPFVANRCLDLTPAAFNTISKSHDRRSS